MDPFPEPWELISLFESEPRLSDVGVAWAYNDLAFTRHRGNDRIECRIAPGYRELGFDWYEGPLLRVRLRISTVTGLEVARVGTEESLIATLADDRAHPLRIQIAPQVSLEWGTDPH